MKKVKITEEQARLLANTPKSGKKIQITQEQLEMLTKTDINMLNGKPDNYVGSLTVESMFDGRGNVPDPSDYLDDAPHNQESPETQTYKRGGDNGRWKHLAHGHSENGDCALVLDLSSNKKHVFTYGEADFGDELNQYSDYTDFGGGDIEYDSLEEHGIEGYLNDHEDEVNDWLTRIDGELPLYDEENSTYMNAQGMPVPVTFNVSETTSTGSVGGGFVPPLNKKPDVYTEADETTPIIKRKIGEPKKRIKLTKEQIALLEATDFGNNTTWKGGGFVKLDDCTKLNNNKKAQNGGCSVGAVDNVVTTSKTPPNIYTEVAKRTGKTIAEVKAIINKNGLN